MRPEDRKAPDNRNGKAGSRRSLPFWLSKYNLIYYFFIVVFFITCIVVAVTAYGDWKAEKEIVEQQELLIALKNAAKEDRNTPIASATPTDIPTPIVTVTPTGIPIPIVTVTPTNTPTPIVTLAPTETPTPDQGPVMLPEYTVLYAENNDVIGWLTIEDTVIDYPVMQTPEDEEYYLRRDFYGKKNKNGCLFMDTDSVAGIGTEEYNYAGGTAPSTNLIIYGHTLKSGLMFGKLDNYKDKTYGMAHKIICFDTLYEKREYELMAVFYLEIFYQSQDVFKYYKFFQADTQEEFDDWYYNIKAMSLYDTGVTAGFGDEFITLSCCSYHVEDGRFAVVAKRIK